MRFPLVVSVLLLFLKFEICSCLCRESTPERTYTIENHLSYHFMEFIYNGSITDCDCDRKACLRKCCEENYVLHDDMCVPSNTSILYNVYDKEDPIEHTSLQQYIIVGIPKCPGHYVWLNPDEIPDDQFYLQKDGRLWQPDGEYYYKNDEYCLESTQGRIWALTCFIPWEAPEETVYTVGLIISMPFLLATFILYALQPEKNVNRKSFMCYVLSLLAAYIFLSIVKSIHLPTAICVSTAFFCYYFFMASFLWMNAMSIDIWWNFSKSRDYSRNTKATARKRFLFYSSYAWGLSFVMVILLVLLNTLSNSESWYHPNVAKSCWIYGPYLSIFAASIICSVSGNTQIFFYFYLPIALTIVFNFIMFVITALKIKKLQKDTAMLHSGQFKKHNEEEQKRFKFYITLSLAMGVNWIMEIVSFMFNWQVSSVPKWAWYLTDLCNALYGIIIFFMFAFKKKILIAAKNRCTSCNTKKPKESLCQSAESAI